MICLNISNLSGWKLRRSIYGMCSNWKHALTTMLRVNALYFSLTALKHCFLGWHNRFAHRIDKKHPNIWHFIRVLQEEEVRFNQHVQHVQMGKKKVCGKRTCSMQECLETLADRFKKQQIDLSDYIQGLSLLVAKKKWLGTNATQFITSWHCF